VSGNYLDDGVRVNSVSMSNRIPGASFSQRLGNLAGPTGVERTSLKFTLVIVNSTKIEIVNVPHPNAVGFPGPFVPTAPQVNGNNGVIITFILPDRKLALYVHFIRMANLYWSGAPDVYRFFWRRFSAITALKAADVSQLLLDLINNGGEIMDNNLGFYSLSSTVFRRAVMS